jgi:anti-sigma-K factor RskA
LLFYPTWRGAAVGAVALLLVFVAGRFVTEAMTPPEFATAASQSPGIYATSFYSSPGKAQVVWLNGLEPASDKPTYLDPSTLETSQPNKPASTRDPNQL